MISNTSQIAGKLTEWYREPTGQRILQQADEALASALPDIVGYYSLELSHFDSQHRWYQQSRIRWQFFGSASDTDATHTICNFAELPFDTESIDSVLIHHVFEFADDPYAIIREIHRVLMPGGQFIIICFNPFGIYGIIKHFKPGLSIPWGGNFFPMARIKEWLSVLGFAVEQSTYIAPLGFHTTSDKKYFSWVSPLFGNYLPISGGLFILLVNKQMTQPIKLKKIFSSVSFLKGRVVQPTAVPHHIVGKENYRDPR